MSAYSDAFHSLNDAQRAAVEHIYGPLLVIAGPGTGKTQLLSTRAAHIVQQGDTSPGNILCLTYTEAGASEMRTRLARIMGSSGNDVVVHTFHSFGSWLINQYPESFTQQRALQPLDDLGRYRVFNALLSSLPLRHPLALRDHDEKFIRQGSVIELIKVCKQAGLSPTDVRAILAANQKDYAALQPLFDAVFGSTLSAKRLPEISVLVADYHHKMARGSYGDLLLTDMAQAIAASSAISKTKPLGDWRTTHLTTLQGIKVLKSAARHDALLAAITLYERYQATLDEQGRFDYEDMVLWAVRALQANQDMCAELAERFQFIMVDEYQDTNGAQNQLLDALLSANPLDSPNIMVVGDDDQAIMRFQGAELSGLMQFISTYQPDIITLTENYRSGQPILDASRQVMVQTDERLETSLPAMQLNKQLTASGDVTNTTLEHTLFISPTAQYQGVAQHIRDLLQAGTPASDIAVIGRKHKELVALTPFLESLDVVVNYDNRENILQDPRINELLLLARYLVLLGERSRRADQLLPAVLSSRYWQYDALQLYRLASQAKQSKTSWLDCMLAHQQADLQQDAQWLLTAAESLKQQNFTSGLDILIGRGNAEPGVGSRVSPFARYFDQQYPSNYVSLLSHLLRLREAVLTSRPQATSPQDMLDTVAEYQRSGITLIDNNPLLRGDEAGVTLLSAHGAKGREYQHIIVLSAVDNVWGKPARGHNQRISLPENLQLYPAGDSESDRLRLLYVAMTRAKSHLLLASYEQTDDGKPVGPLSYLQGNDAWQPHAVTLDAMSSISALEMAWAPHAAITPRDLQSIIRPLLPHFRLSPTALGSFLNICYAGPQAFLESTVFGYPSAYSASSALGQAAHGVLEQAHQAYAAGKPFEVATMSKVFNDLLDASGLPAEELLAVRAHGEQFLPEFVDRFRASDFAAITNTEQYVAATLPLGDVPFGGKIDALARNATGLTVLDYKTGKPPLPEWRTSGLTEGKKISLHFYRQQLLCYKLLLDNSRGLKDAGVTAAELVFVEPPETGDEYVRLAITEFTAEELDTTARLINAVYQRVLNGEMPDTSGYSLDLKGIKQFEADLLQT